MLPNYEEQYKDLETTLKDLSSQAIQVHKEVLSAFLSKDIEKLNDAVKNVSEYEKKANIHDNDTIKLVARYQPEGQMLRTVVSSLKITNELVRIVAAAKIFTKNATIIIESNFDYSAYSNEITKLYETSIEALELSISDGWSVENAQEIMSEIKAKETVTDEYYQFLQDNMLSSILTKGANAKDVFKVLRIMRKLERVADHAVNISYLVNYTLSGGKLESF